MRLLLEKIFVYFHLLCASLFRSNSSHGGFGRASPSLPRTNPQQGLGHRPPQSPLVTDGLGSMGFPAGGPPPELEFPPPPPQHPLVQDSLDDTVQQLAASMPPPPPQVHVALVRLHISGVTKCVTKFLTLSKSPHCDSVKKLVTRFVTPEIKTLR